MRSSGVVRQNRHPAVRRRALMRARRAATPNSSLTSMRSAWKTLGGVTFAPCGRRNGRGASRWFGRGGDPPSRRWSAMRRAIRRAAPRRTAETPEPTPLGCSRSTSSAVTWECDPSACQESVSTVSEPFVAVNCRLDTPRSNRTAAARSVPAASGHRGCHRRPTGTVRNSHRRQQVVRSPARGLLVTVVPTTGCRKYLQEVLRVAATRPCRR
jgi:hypothetical protein